MNEWISVKDKLPPLGNQVLLFVQSETCSIDYDTNEEIGDTYIEKEMAIGYIEDGVLWINYDQDGFYSASDVTHWMPLPSPPEGENK